jgi:2-oxo-3-(phosphooxy)propyl 3-oxoalkanoate synthase
VTAGGRAASVVGRAGATAHDGRPPELSFDATIARRLVHKAAIEQVLLCDARQISEREFACAAQLSRAHAYYSDHLLPIYDPLLVLEIARQGVVLGSHEYLGVPEGWQFIFSDIRGTVDDLDALRIGSAPADCVVRLSLEDDRYRRGQLSSARFRAKLERDGTLAATLVGTATFFSRERYAVLRKSMARWTRNEPPPPPLVPAPPAAVGRASARNVVVSEPERSEGRHVCDVIVDESQPSFFDHPLDHVPGSLLIEAFRQTAVAAACSVHSLPPERALVADYSAEYSRLGELGARIRCGATVGELGADAAAPRVAVDLSLEQFGSSISDARYVLAFPDA